jgi:hypothetical protein
VQQHTSLASPAHLRQQRSGAAGQFQFGSFQPVFRSELNRGKKNLLITERHNQNRPGRFFY